MKKKSLLRSLFLVGLVVGGEIKFQSLVTPARGAACVCSAFGSGVYGIISSSHQSDNVLTDSVYKKSMYTGCCSGTPYASSDTSCLDFCKMVAQISVGYGNSLPAGLGGFVLEEGLLCPWLTNSAGDQLVSCDAHWVS